MTHHSIRAAITIVSLWVVAGCGTDSADTGEASESSPPGPASAQGSGSEPDSATRPETEIEADTIAPQAAVTQDATGTLEGAITLGGSLIPSPTRVTNTTDPEICGTEHSLQDIEVSEEGRGIGSVIVALGDLSEDRIPDRPPEHLTIDNRECQFAPHVAVATVGDSIVALNSDPMLHTTHYYGPMRGNIALAEQGMAVSRVASLAGLVTILCDVHGWMKAYIRVDAHPFHTVSDAEGHYRIEGIPGGSYTLELWHERLGERRVEVAVEPGRITTVDVEYPPVDA